MSGKERETKITIRTGFHRWRSLLMFALMNAILVGAIGASKAWFGGSWLIDIMIGGLWLMGLVAISQTLPSSKSSTITTPLSPDEVRAALAKARTREGE